MPDYSNEASAQLYAAGSLWCQVEAKAYIYETFPVHFHTVSCKTVLRAEGNLKLELRRVTSTRIPQKGQSQSPRTGPGGVTRYKKNVLHCQRN